MVGSFPPKRPRSKHGNVKSKIKPKKRKRHVQNNISSVANLKWESVEKKRKS